MFRSDGRTVMCGANTEPLGETGVSCMRIAAGVAHAVFLLSDGRVMAFGSNFARRCALPEVEAGISYTDVAAGHSHTVLLRSDGNLGVD